MCGCCSGAMQHWPAMTRWQKPAYLKQVAGLRTVPVELGDHYLQDGWGQCLMPLRDFIVQHVLGKDPSLGKEEADKRRGYLAQHPLFEQIPELARDIMEPEYCSLGEGDMQSVNAWFGPASTVRACFLPLVAKLCIHLRCTCQVDFNAAKQLLVPWRNGLSELGLYAVPYSACACTY